MTLSDKIEAFKKEVGNRTLTEEQRRIYNEFCKTKGKGKTFFVIDKAGKQISFVIYCDKFDCGTQHILKNHYMENKGRVTAVEILNMLDVIKYGVPHKSNAYTVYSYKHVSGSVKLNATLRLTKQGLLKSFYSDRGIKKR